MIRQPTSGTETSPIDVAAALIQKPDGEFLLAQRPAGKVYAGYWEFPGGKVHAGESVAAALARELEEELGLVIEESHPWLTQVFTYPHATVKLHFRRVTRWRGDPHGREAQQFAWQLPERLTLAPMLPANTFVLRALALSPMYAITNAAELGFAPMLSKLEAALRQGLKLVQVREKELSPDHLEHFAKAALALARHHGAKLLINRELALAEALGADGVHLTAAQLRTCAARPPLPWCGASCHDAEELARAIELGVDFAVLGPVQKTVSHPNANPLGWVEFGRLLEDCPIPVYAIGGMRAVDLATAWRHGAHGVASQRAVWRAG